VGCAPDDGRFPFPGFLGAGILRPGHVGQDWHVVYRFDSAAHLSDWERSPVRSASLAGAENLMETTAVRRVSGLETWFALPGHGAPAPPKWKMFVTSLSGIYVLQLVANAALGPLVGSWAEPAQLATFACIVTAAMTWIVMPRLARLLARWLYAPPPP
jgi:uncharacterized protein